MVSNLQVAGQQRQGLPAGQPAHAADPGAGVPLRAGRPARRLHVPRRRERRLRAAPGQDTQGQGQDHVRSGRLNNTDVAMQLHLYSSERSELRYRVQGG